MTEPTESPLAPAAPGEMPRPDPGSFRDPGSRVFLSGGKVYRTLDQRALENWETLAATDFFTAQVARGRIVATEPATDTAPVPGDWAGVLRHETIPVISYPYEWTFSMLRDAALLQLDLLSAALDEDMILKDATPYNIQWRGTRPVFIDVGSFERLERGEVWVGYRQFLRQYLYPLMLRAYVGIPFQPWLRGEPEGPTAGELRRMLPLRHAMRKATLLHVSLQARAERRYSPTSRDVRSELKAAGFRKELIATNIRGLRKEVERLQWQQPASGWSGYAEQCTHVAAQRDAKTAFLARSLGEYRPRIVWDLGANDGHFSKQAAAAADHVVALDADEGVLDDLYRSLSTEGVDNVLPLLQDLTDPSPGLGWRGEERRPLWDRSSPDLVLCFALIHHLVIGGNLPLRHVVDWLADLKSRVIVELVPPQDPMARQLAVNKRPHELHPDYTEDAFRAYIADRFVIDHEEPVPDSGRRLFALTPRG